jgi:hypothetical protein
MRLKRLLNEGGRKGESRVVLFRDIYAITDMNNYLNGW